jgi:hypothetical protein
MKFQSTVLQSGKSATGIPIPPEIIERLDAGKRPALHVTVNGYTYRTTVGFMDGQPMLSLSAENRENAGLQAGDMVEVTVEVATEPPTIEVPSDLTAALNQAGVIDAFEASAPSRRKEYVRQVTSAKTEETRQRRILKVVQQLAGG